MRCAPGDCCVLLLCLAFSLFVLIWLLACVLDFGVLILWVFVCGGVLLLPVGYLRCVPGLVVLYCYVWTFGVFVLVCLICLCVGFECVALCGFYLW